MGTANELQVVLQMAAPLKELLVLAMVTAYFLSESSTSFLISFFHCAKVCDHDYLVVNVYHFASEGCNGLINTTGSSLVFGLAKLCEFVTTSRLY